MLKSYLKKISKIANQGDAREESYYATLEELFKKIAQSFGKDKIHITTLPKTTEAGNPDFRVWDGKQHKAVLSRKKACTCSGGCIDWSPLWLWQAFLFRISL
jgi:hypothetical protein